jgi:hypothetical protein
VIFSVVYLLTCRLLGCPFRPPDEATIRRVLESVDAAALEAAVGSWLAARLQPWAIRTRTIPAFGPTTGG